MSAKEPEQNQPSTEPAHEHENEHAHEHGHSEDNYDAAYSGDAPAMMPPTPVHGYWRSLRELDESTPISSNEFPAMAEVSDPMHRRNFFQLMGASMALAGVAGCRYEKEEIVPLARRPEGQVPGQAQEYATAFELGGVGQALVATSYEGRPIRIDGNPEHPFASGGVVTGTTRHAGASSFAQASILNMYDPDRSQSPSQGGKGGSMDGFRAALAGVRAGLAGGRILSEATSSPTVLAMKAKLLAKYPGLQWVEYEPLSHDNERAGTRLAFGRTLRPFAHLDQAETIVTIDCDLFVEHPASLAYSRDFARSRRVNGSLGIGKMNRLWSIESVFTHTGAMADHRLGVRSEHGLAIALALDAALGGGATPNAELLREAKVSKYIKVLAEELNASKGQGRAVVIAGRRQSPEVHAVVARINNALGAVGKTLSYHEEIEPDRPRHVDAIKALVGELNGTGPGKVNTLVILGGNPVYDAPADLDFAGALAKVGTSIHLSEFLNETSQKTSWHIPRTHYLEAWGDTRTWDGTISVSQPLIAPLYSGVSVIEMLSLLLGEERTGEELVRTTHEDLGVGGNWRQSIHDGFVPNSALPLVENAQIGQFTVPSPTGTAAGGSVRSGGDVEVTFHYSYSSYDGRYANNAWLQETPDFLTKVTWDNYALVGPETADQLKVANDTLIKVTIDNRSITLPCYTMPGQARGSIALVLGGGRTAAGRVGGVGKKTVGVDTYKVRTVAGFDYAVSGRVAPTGDTYELASVQEHWDIRTGLKPSVNQAGIAERLPELVRETTAVALAADKSWQAEPHTPYWDDANAPTDGPKRHLALFREHEYKGHKWGMAIDLTTCTGCNSCMVACQAENNLPVVGRKEIFHNREMHWIRIDRYFGGSRTEPVVVHQPVTCQQCENAPCEQVCPVGATSHSDEGLNDMAYNRCIGTRYCANNCPYKVRKFNFLDWNKEWREARNKVRRLLFNPEVTVRMRGVMEKCTFCVQRIQNAKIRAKAQIRNGTRAGSVDGPLADGEVVTACQQACPSECITFGDLSDKNSRISRLHEDRRSYDLLPELYTKPRNRYLAKVRNPNPSLAPAAAPAPHGGAATEKANPTNPQAGGH
jgi:Fe-S-cluster-containing dehydrogenase component